MNKVGIVAVTYKDNFGSALQTYATQYVLAKLGYDPYIFNINGIHKLVNAKKVFFFLKSYFVLGEKKYLFENLKSRSRKKISSSGDKYAQNMKIRHQKYVEFNEKWFNMLPPKKTWSGLESQAQTMEAVVVGSDQLWRPSNIEGGYFTLEFVPDEVKKIALSTSFGVPVLPEFIWKHARKFLNRIEYISVRENSGANIIKDITGREVLVACDPTMLLTAKEWMCIQTEKPLVEGKYILCYFMGDDPKHRDFVRRLKTATGYKIVGLLHGATYVAIDEGFADEEPYNIGPSEFINLIRNAEYMCTDSFHGTVFSILNRTSFFSFRRDSEDSIASTNDRLHTLLDWTGLADRMLVGDENIEDCISKRIDFEEVHKKVAFRRNETMEFFENALKSKK